MLTEEQKHLFEKYTTVGCYYGDYIGGAMSLRAFFERISFYCDKNELFDKFRNYMLGESNYPNRNMELFDYDPYTGEKINWVEIANAFTRLPKI